MITIVVLSRTSNLDLDKFVVKHENQINILIFFKNQWIHVIAKRQIITNVTQEKVLTSRVGHASQNNIIITQWREPIQGPIQVALHVLPEVFFGFIHNIGICTTPQHCVIQTFQDVRDIFGEVQIRLNSQTLM